MRYDNLVRVIFVVLLFFGLAGTASAHRVVVFAWVDGDTVFTESQFPDGKRVVDGEMKVYDLSGNTLLNGKTNANGEFSFKIPKPVGMRIVLNAGMGHQGEWTLSEAEVKGSPDSPPSSEIKPVEDNMIPEKVATANHSESADLKTIQPDLPVRGLTDKEIEQIVERVIDKKLKPVTQMLVELRQPGPTLSDIFGGIGYILGLMGITLYFKSKKKHD